MKESMEMVGERLRVLRENRGMKQAEVADKIGMQRSSYSKVEAGIYALQTGYCVELAELYNTSCDYILRGIEAKNLDFAKESGFSNKAINALLSVEDRRCTLLFLNKLLESEDFPKLARQYLSYSLAEKLQRMYEIASLDEKKKTEFWEEMGIPYESLRKQEKRVFGKEDEGLYIFTIPGYLKDMTAFNLYQLIKIFEATMTITGREMLYGCKPDEDN